MNLKFFNALREHRTTPMVRAVGLALAIRAKPNHAVCWPSVPTLCKDASASRESVKRAIAKLEDAGLIHVERRPGVVNRYTLNPSTDEPGNPSTPETGSGRGKLSATRLQMSPHPSTGEPRIHMNSNRAPDQEQYSTEPEF